MGHYEELEEKLKNMNFFEKKEWLNKNKPKKRDKMLYKCKVMKCDGRVKEIYFEGGRKPSENAMRLLSEHNERYASFVIEEES